MQEDIKKIVEFFEKEKFKEFDYLPLSDDFFDLNAILKNKLNERLYNDYFRFLDKYRNNMQFFEMVTDELGESFTLLKLFLPSDYYDAINSYYYQKDPEHYLSNYYLMDSSDVLYLTSLGFSLKQIVNESEGYTSDAMKEIYLRDKTLAKDIINKSQQEAYIVAALEFIDGNKDILKLYFDVSYGLGGLTNLFRSIVDNCNSFDFDYFLNTLMQNEHFTNSSFAYNDISFIEDNNLIAELIKKGNSRALIFAKNPTSEIIELASNFSFDDYIFLDGNYKKSEDLLLLFLNKGNMEALNQAPIEAFGDKVYNFLVKNKIDLSTLSEYPHMYGTYVYAKYLTNFDRYDGIEQISDVFTNIKSFNFVLDMIKSGKYLPPKLAIDKKQASALYYLYNKEFERAFDIRFGKDFSLEVSKGLLDIGLTADEYMKYFEYDKNLSICFLEKGNYEVLFKHSFIDGDFFKYIDNVTYEMFLETKEKYGISVIPLDIYAKFVKEGHYEIFLNATFDTYSADSYILHLFGFDNLSYEDYQKLPQYVRDLPYLKSKFLEYDESYYMEVLNTNPTSKALEAAALHNMPYSEFIKYLDGKGFYLTLPTIMHYLNEGNLDALQLISKMEFINNIDELIDKILELTKGEFPDPSLIVNDNIMKALIVKFIKKHDFSVLKYANNYETSYIDLLEENGYTFDDFCKWPFYNGKLIAKFITKENEEKIINYFKENFNEDNKYFPNSEYLILKAYKTGYKLENVVTLVDCFSISPSNIYKLIDDGDYSIFDKVPFNLIFSDRTMVDNLLNRLSLETIRKQFNFYLDDNIRCYIIEKMVDLGHYDFVRFFVYRVPEKTLKKALLAGYLPSEEDLINNDKLKRAIGRVKFSKEELDYLKTNIDKQPLLIIFFPEFTNNPDLIAQYTIKDSRIILYCEELILKQPEILKKVVVTNPLALKPILRKLDHDLVFELIKINPELAKLCDLTYFKNEEILEIIDIYPEVIDLVRYRNDEMIIKAINNGYKLKDKVPNDILINALKNGIDVDINIILDRSYNDLFNLVFNNFYYFEDKKDFVNNIFDTLYNRDKDEFVWQLVSYTRKSGYYGNALNLILEYNDRYNTNYNKLGHLVDDSKERYLFNILLLEINQLSDEEFYKRIDDLLSKTNFKYDIIKLISNRGNEELTNKYVKQYFEEDPVKLLEFVSEIDDELTVKISNVIFDNPDLFDNYLVYSNISRILKTKEEVLKAFEVGSEYFFDYLDDKFRKDFDILSAYLEKRPYYIKDISPDVERYKELCCKALAIDPTLYKDIDSPLVKTDGELLKTLLLSYPSAFIYADSSLQTLEYFKLITDYRRLDFENINASLFEKMISFNLFSDEDDFLRTNIITYLIEHVDELSDEVFTNKFIIQVFNNSIENNFKQMILLSKRFNNGSLAPEVYEILNNANLIISRAGKVNLLEKTSLLSYDLVKYIYPVMGMDVTLDLLKYNSKAPSQLTKFIKTGQVRDILQYWEFVKEFYLFPNNERLIHMAFMDYDKFNLLMADIIPKKNSLNEQDLANLRKIIINHNVYGIETFEELKNYDKTVNMHVTELLNGDNIVSLKNNLAALFGFENIKEMSDTFRNFQLDNFAKLSNVYADIKNKYGLLKLKEVALNKEDIKLITLMKRIIESNNILEIKELFSNMMDKGSKSLDYSDEMDNLINKVRKIYNLQFNSRLTQVEDIKSTRLDKNDPNNKYGVTIIKMDGEPFRFLAHRIYSYDAHMVSGQKSFKQLLTEDPSLWTKLDGASTLSTSSFSDKGFWFLNHTDSSGVVYLFNSLPPDFLLFMEGRDLYVEHGGHCLNPTARDNSFADIDSLNQGSCYHSGSYNEVAGFRNGMMPCAFACVGKEPNEETIKAAKYFSEVLHVDIPIIMFDVLAYDNAKYQKYEDAKIEYSKTSSIEALNGIFFDGRKVPHGEAKELDTKVDFCLDALKNRYYNKEITIYELLRKVQELENVANRIFSTFTTCSNGLKKIQLYKKTLFALQRISREEIIKLETANMGESGIMYKFEDEGKTYLVKPAVDKQRLQEQPFRAEIQAAASKLQKIITPETAVDVESIRATRVSLSKQELLDINKEETKKLINWANNGGPIEQKYLDQLLREYVLDFVLCNFDAFSGNFVIDNNGNIRGIDKEQSFRFIDEEASLQADFSYVPNGNARIPIYKIMFERYKNKEINLNLDIVFDTLDELKKISDEEYIEIFKDYAVSLGKDKAQELLEKILNRKHIASSKIEEFMSSLGYSEEMDGVTL